MARRGQTWDHERAQRLGLAATGSVERGSIGCSSARRKRLAALPQADRRPRHVGRMCRVSWFVVTAQIGRCALHARAGEQQPQARIAGPRPMVAAGAGSASKQLLEHCQQRQAPYTNGCLWTVRRPPQLPSAAQGAAFQRERGLVL